MHGRISRAQRASGNDAEQCAPADVGADAPPRQSLVVIHSKEMESLKDKRAQITLAALAGVFFSFLWGVLIENRLESLGFEFYYIGTSTLFAVLFVFIGGGVLLPVITLGGSFYFSSYWLVPHWGQLGPFDIFFMLLYSIPAILIGYFAAKTITRFRRGAGNV